MIGQHPAVSLGIGLCCIINAEHPLITGWRAKSLVAACTAVGCEVLAMTNDNEWVACHCFFYNRWDIMKINIPIIISIILESPQILTHHFFCSYSEFPSLPYQCCKCVITMLNSVTATTEILMFSLK